jgi:hypothetical protein
MYFVHVSHASITIVTFQGSIIEMLCLSLFANENFENYLT